MSGEPKNGREYVVDMGEAPWNEVLATIEEIKKMGRVTRGGMLRFRKAPAIEKLLVAHIIQNGTLWATKSFYWSGVEMIAQLKSKGIKVFPDVEGITTHLTNQFYMRTMGSVYEYQFVDTQRLVGGGEIRLLQILELAKSQGLRPMSLEAALLFREKFRTADLLGHTLRLVCRRAEQTFLMEIGELVRTEFISVNSVDSHTERLEATSLFLCVR